MSYDLYGTYYASERDALNAEMAQCAAIDASHASREVRELQDRQQAEMHFTEQWKEHVEKRLAALEAFSPNSICEGEAR